MHSVLILMSTYNGANFLEQQLDSLYSQKNVSINILVRDDGSEDQTIEILMRYKSQYGRMTLLTEKNVGAARSFFRLMNYSVSEMSKYDFYAFCDQDDVWFDNKLEEAVNHLNSTSSRPQLFFSDVQIVNSELNAIKSKSSIKTNENFYASIIANHSLGCTQVFNYSLLEQAAKIWERLSSYYSTYNVIPMHDGWVSRVAHSLDAKIVYHNSPLMLYRQHSQNVVGAETSKIALLKKRIKRYLFSKSRRKSLICKYLLDTYPYDISDEKSVFLELCADYDKSITNKINLLTCKHIYQYGIVENLGLIAMILLNKF